MSESEQFCLFEPFWVPIFVFYQSRRICVEIGQGFDIAFVSLNSHLGGDVLFCLETVQNSEILLIYRKIHYSPHFTSLFYFEPRVHLPRNFPPDMIFQPSSGRFVMIGNKSVKDLRVHQASIGEDIGHNFSCIQ